MIISFTLNHLQTQINTNPMKPLLDVLRENLQLTGTKQGCDHEGECGACTVLLNGKPIRSCLTPVGRVQGQQILTVEGLGSRDNPHPLQTAFIKNGAVQCGYCIPGTLLTAKSLLDGNPDPSREDIQQALSGNICRCTGYQPIIQAVQDAAKEIQQQDSTAVVNQDQESEIIGGNPWREDSWEKVTGQTQYAEDIQIADLHHLAVLRSPFHHAKLISLEITEAIKLPGVENIITAEDIPGENGLGDYSRDEPVLTPVGDTCKMKGAPVALIVAVSPAVCSAALDAIQINYQELPAVFEVGEAKGQISQPIYDHGNILTTAEVKWGELEEVFRDTDHILESSYQTSWQEHTALERETLLGYYDEQGRLTVVGGTHEPHWQQRYIASTLALPLDAVRVIMPPTGGSFGGKQDPWPFLATALGVHLSGKPLRLLYSREESLLASPKRHPYQITLKLGAQRNGKLAGIHTRAEVNTGGYDGHGQYIVDYALVGSGGPYRYQAVDGKAESIYSNGPKGGQFRGFGTPQPTFALECALDEMAQALELDPLDFRILNILEQEGRSFLGYPVQESLGYQQVLSALKPKYQVYLTEAQAYNQDQPEASPYRKGVGLAGMWYRFGKSGSLKVEAWSEISPSGELIIYCSAPDYGQGSSTAMSQMAAEVLGVSRDALKVVNADTALTPDSGIQGASRATYFVGGAVVQAARNLKDALLTTGAEILDCPPASLVLSMKGIQRQSREESSQENFLISYQDLAQEFNRLNLPTRYQGIFDLSKQFPEETRPAYIPLFVTGAQIAEVLVNLHTGEVKVLRMTAAHDVGRAVNPLDARGQIEGAIMMGLGTALMEEYLPGITQGLGDYVLPTSMSTPEIEVILIEEPSFEGPFGVKGLGEAAILPTAPAIINAISRAIETRIYRLPATPERVLGALERHAVRGS